MATYYNRVNQRSVSLSKLNTHSNTVIPLLAVGAKKPSLLSGLTLNHTGGLAVGAISAVQDQGKTAGAGG